MNDHRIDSVNRSAACRTITLQAGHKITISINNGDIVRKIFPKSDLRTVYESESLQTLRAGYSPTRAIDHYALKTVELILTGELEALNKVEDGNSDPVMIN